MDRARNRDRLKAALGAAALQAGLGYALITGLGFEVTRIPEEILKVYDITPPPPPPLVEPVRNDEAQGEAAPPNLRAEPAPVVAPKPRVPLPVPPPVTAAPVASPGTDSSAGATDRPGPGTGAGGVGSGLGSGGQGTGTGSGSARARRVRGGLSFDRDYPRAARAIRAEGAVYVRIAIAPDGRVSGCTVTRSSGNHDLDRTTCRLIQQRFRYTPARDGGGRAVADFETTSFDWRLLS